MPARKLRVLIDADVLFAGAASPSTHGASYTILQLAELTLIECLVSNQVIVEAERNLSEKLPNKLSAFRKLVNCCLQVVPDLSRAD
jgi:predicted nucleic acid-binding protein